MPGHSDCNGARATRTIEGTRTRRVVSVSLFLLATVPQACQPDLPTAPRGSSSTGAVTSRAATRLAFATPPPASGEANVVISPRLEVVLQDSLGHTVLGASDTVTLALADNPSDAVLLGTTTVVAVDGLATFADLSVDRPGSYRLAATAAGLTATSISFAAHVTFASVDGGYVHSCGVATGGAGYCWGDNAVGQLGDGNSTSPYRSSPAPVAGGLRFTTISAGIWHSCGVTTSGAAYCWGDNFFGQLGNGSSAEATTPVPVAGGFRFASVSAGSFHTCGITTSGTAYCWGDNQNAQLGDGTMERRAMPAPVAGGFRFTTISAGHGHTCGVITGGVAVCWGDDSSGQLGDGTAAAAPNTSRSHPARVVGVRRFAAVSAGNVHTCGVTTGGVVYCWGYNIWGQLGDGTTTQRSQPVPVAARLRFAAVDAGSYSSCGVTIDGAAYCWGENVDGEVGDGTTVSRSSPVPVAGGLRFATVRAGWYHVCGMLAGRGASCWGYNAHGQLGDGTTTSTTAPAPLIQ